MSNTFKTIASSLQTRTIGRAFACVSHPRHPSIRENPRFRPLDSVLSSLAKRTTGCTSFLLILWAAWLLAACTYGDYAQPDIVPAKERIRQAVKELEDRLLKPDDGWATYYNPNAGRKATENKYHETGRDYRAYYMLLKFSKDGTVNIRSQLEEQGGIYKNQTITWRIELRQMPVLVLEDYGIFHYLAEKITHVHNSYKNWPDKIYFLSRAEFQFGYDRTKNKGKELQLISFDDRVNEQEEASLIKLLPATKKNLQDFGL